MKASGTKIIIKPRLVRHTATATAGAGPSKATTQPSSHRADDGEEGSETHDAEQEEEEEEEGEEEGEALEEEDEEEDETASPAHTPGSGEVGMATDSGFGITRGRGRGRGRGNDLVSGPPRPRGRPRGSGRGRGRGRGSRDGSGGGGFTIRLPRLGGEEGQVASERQSAPGVLDGGVDEKTPTAELEEIEKETPMGGGKPFRKIQGNVYVIENDEFITEDDPKGDTKIDKNGNLLGGRRFKASTFILPQRHPERVYMLAIDAARSSGFRDSLYYFRRNPLAFKLNATQPEKEYLIEQGKLGSHLRTRSVTLITARSAFKLHGSKMIIDGRWVGDDYYEEKALEEAIAKGIKPGTLVGELPDPQSHTSEATASANLQMKADRGGSGLGVYRAGGPTTIFGGSGLGPYSDGPHNAVKKSMLNREGLSEENWMYVAAQRTVEAGEEWARIAREALKPSGVGDASGKGKEERAAEDESVTIGDAGEVKDEKKQKRQARIVWGEQPMGVYEPHTGMVQYRADTQPTRCRWIPLPDSGKRRRVLGGTKTGNGAWALAWVDTLMEMAEPEEFDKHRWAREELLRAVDELS